MRPFLAAVIFAVAWLAFPAPTAHAADTTTVVALFARVNNRFVTADHAGTDPLLAQRGAAGVWETFDVEPVGSGGWVALKSRANGKYVTADNAGADPLIANRATVGTWEQFQIQARPDGAVNIFARANRHYVTAEQAGTAPLIANRTTAGAWEAFDVTTEAGVPVAGVPIVRTTALWQAVDDDNAVDVQPLGDSWTGGGNGCNGATPDNWRAAAAPRLVAAIPQALYVGATQQGCSGDTWNSGWGGRKMADGLANDMWRQWLTGLHPTGATPDVVVLELGINDFWAGNCSAVDCLDRIDLLVGKILAVDWRIRVVVCDIPKIALPADRQAEIAAYDAALPGRLDHYGATRVGVARLSTHWDPAKTSDGGFHPSVAGYDEVADAILDSPAWPIWYGVTP